METKKKQQLKNKFAALWNSPAAFPVLSSVMITAAVESLSRHSLSGGFRYAFEHPVFFLMNCMIVAFFMSLTYLVPKRVFAQGLVATVFLTLGIVNCVLLYTRVNPFEAVDLLIFRTGFTITLVYMKPYEIVLCVLAIAIVIAGLVLLFIKGKKQRVRLKYSLLNMITTAILAVSLLVSSVLSGAIPSSLTDMIDSYDKYGFIYCFARSIFDRGISEPDDYSEYTIDEILDSIGNETTSTPSSKPNIIMVQLESFMDPEYFKNFSFEYDPVPNYRRLKEEGTTGLLYVPSVGSGTANTEFEVLSGMNLDYFGTGEYPFQTILKTRNCETICYNLKELGYSTFGFHNHTGTFYHRNIVYSNLGFDCFTPLEYMNGFETNAMGWAKDYVLTGQIKQAIESTDGTDFVFAVTVQGHGKYPTEPVEGERLIKCTGIEDESLEHQFEYYAYQLYETDQFIGQLTEYLENCQEDCILVLYGDHQPSIDYSVDDISLDSKFSSEYVIWNNFGLDIDGKNLEAYQLSAYIEEQLGINNGILTKLHQNYSSSEKYQSALEMLQYDMLYGNMLAHGGNSTYTRDRDMKLGLDDITVDSLAFVDGHYYVLGNGFTRWSHVYVNDRSRTTRFISEGVLLLDSDELSSGDAVTVRQVADDFTTLGSTQPYIYQNESKFDRESGEFEHSED